MPLPSIPVVVASPAQGPLTSTEPLDVLHRPPSRDTASAVPALVMLCGIGVLALTLGSIVRRRRPLAGGVAAATTTHVLVHTESVRTVRRERWDIEAVERAAAGIDR